MPMVPREAQPSRSRFGHVTSWSFIRFWRPTRPWSGYKMSASTDSFNNFSSPLRTRNGKKYFFLPLSTVTTIMVSHFPGTFFLQLFSLFFFLNATTRLYKRSCPFVGPSVPCYFRTATTVLPLFYALPLIIVTTTKKSEKIPSLMS